MNPDFTDLKILHTKCWFIKISLCHLFWVPTITYGMSTSCAHSGIVFVAFGREHMDRAICISIYPLSVIFQIIFITNMIQSLLTAFFSKSPVKLEVLFHAVPECQILHNLHTITTNLYSVGNIWSHPVLLNHFPRTFSQV